jgi:hypothetical protein
LAERERYAWNTLRPIVAMALVVAFALVPAFVVFAGTFHLLEARSAWRIGPTRRA